MSELVVRLGDVELVGIDDSGRGGTVIGGDPLPHDATRLGWLWLSGVV